MKANNKTHTLSFRLAEEDYQKLLQRCAETELSQSKYLRYLIRIPVLAKGANEEAQRCVVLDRKAMRDMSRELTRWGYHYNQAVHGLNSINYHIAHGRANSSILDGKAESIEVSLETVNQNAERIVYELAQMQASCLIKD